jgi:hypothetical protein
VTATLPADRFTADTITFLGAVAVAMAGAVISQLDSASSALAFEAAVLFLVTRHPFQPPPLHPSNGAPPP